jgi:hypothetical protein
LLNHKKPLRNYSLDGEIIMSQESKTQPGIFADLKVIDCASFIAGPVAKTVLSDFGAEVIKLELPGIGDAYRYMYQTPPNPRLKENLRASGAIPRVWHSKRQLRGVQNESHHH